MTVARANFVLRRILRAGSAARANTAAGTSSGVEPAGDYWDNYRPIEAGDGLEDATCALVFFAVAAAMLVSIAVVLREPWWPGFEERGPGLVMMTCVSSLVLGGATLVVDDHAPSFMIISQSPKLWMGLRLGGSAAFTSCLMIRLHAINALYIKRAKHEPPWFLIMFVKYMLPWGVVVGLKLTLSVMPALYVLVVMIGCCELLFLVWMMASLDRRPIVRPFNVHSLSLCFWLPSCVQALPLRETHGAMLLGALGYRPNPDWDPKASKPTVVNRNHVPDANAVILCVFLMQVVNMWHAVAIETELPTAAASTGPVNCYYYNSHGC